MRGTVKEIVAEVRAIYAELARRPIDRQCQARGECCFYHLTGLIPHLTKGEVLVAAWAFRATGRKDFTVEDDGVCPMLKRETRRCLIYGDRPFACRTHFCEPAGGPYARKDVVDLIRRLEDVDRRLKGDGPHQLYRAVAAALAEWR